MKIRTSWVAAMAVLFVASAAVSWGGTITIINSSFENPSCGTTGPISCSPVGWTVSGVGAAFLPASGDTHAFDGSQYAVANTGGSLTQDLLTDVTANTEYTFTVEELLRTGLSFTGEVELVAGGTDVLATATGTTPSAGTWGQFTLTYTSPSSGAPIGQDLSVVLTSNGIQGDFDDLSNITTSNVPEPSMMMLCGAGLLAFGVARRRRVR